MYAIARVWENPSGLAIPVLKEAVQARIKMLGAYTSEQLGGLGSHLDVATFLLLNALSYYVPPETVSTTLNKKKRYQKLRAASAYKHERWLELERTLYIKRVGRLSEDVRKRVVKRLLKLKWRKDGVPFEYAPILMRGSTSKIQWWDEATQTFCKLPSNWTPPQPQPLRKGRIHTKLEVLTGDFTLDHYLLLSTFEPLCYLQTQLQVVTDLLPWVLEHWQARDVMPLKMRSLSMLQSVRNVASGGGRVHFAAIPTWAKPPCIRSLEHYIQHQRHPNFPQRVLHTSYYSQVSQDVGCVPFLVDTYWRPACERESLPLSKLTSMQGEAKCTTENTLKGQCSHSCKYAVEQNMCVWANPQNQLRDIEDIVVRLPLEELGHSKAVQDACIDSIRTNGRWATQRCSLLQQTLTQKIITRGSVRSPASFTLGLLLASANVKV